MLFNQTGWVQGYSRLAIVPLCNHYFSHATGWVPRDDHYRQVSLCNQVTSPLQRTGSIAILAGQVLFHNNHLHSDFDRAGCNPYLTQNNVYTRLTFSLKY